MVRSVFVDPVFFVLLLGMLGLIVNLRWHRLGLLLVALAFALLYALSTEYVSAALLGAVEIVPAQQAAVDPANPPAAIVVLSGNIRKVPSELGGDMVGEETLERVRQAARLHRETGLPLLVSGGPVPGATKTLARTMTEALQRDFGISVDWEEDRSKTTYENAKFSARILGAAGISSIYLVTHASHMPRAVEIFERWGFRVVPVPTGFTLPVQTVSLASLMPRAVYLAASSRAMREIFGVTFYRWVY